MGDLFDALFSRGGRGGGRGGRKNQMRKGEDVVFPLKVNLEDMYNGQSKKLRLTKYCVFRLHRPWEQEWKIMRMPPMQRQWCACGRASTWSRHDSTVPNNVSRLQRRR